MTKTLEEFKEKWSRRLEEIKAEPMSKSQCGRIHDNFQLELHHFFVFNPKYGPQDLLELQNDLNYALEISLSKYQQSRFSFWARLFPKKVSVKTK